MRHSEQIQQGCARSCPPAGSQPGSWQVSKETGARARPGRKGEPLSAITAGCVSFVAMLIPGAVIASDNQPRMLGCAAGCPACCPESAARPGTAAQWPASGGRSGCAALAAARAPGHEPHDDDDGHRNQPDDEKRLERCDDPAHSRDGKRYGEDRAEDCPDDPAHIPSMRPGPGCRTAPAATSRPGCGRTCRTGYRDHRPGPRRQVPPHHRPGVAGRASSLSPARAGRRPAGRPVVGGTDGGIRKVEPPQR